MTREVVGRGDARAKVELISLSRRVSYADLDLSLHTDVMEIEQRVKDLAALTCGELAKMFPLSDPNTPDCVKEAIASAKPQIEKAVPLRFGLRRKSR